MPRRHEPVTLPELLALVRPDDVEAIAVETGVQSRHDVAQLLDKIIHSPTLRIVAGALCADGYGVTQYDQRVQELRHGR